MAVAPQQWIISDKQLLVPKFPIESGFHPHRIHSDTKSSLFSLLIKILIVFDLLNPFLQKNSKNSLHLLGKLSNFGISDQYVEKL